MLRCQVNSVSPLPLAKSEPEWYLDCAMHLGTSVAACRFHRYVPALSFQSRFFVSNVYFSHTLPWVHLHSASGWDFSFCCRKIQHHRQADSCTSKTLAIQWQQKHDLELIIQHLQSKKDPRCHNLSTKGRGYAQLIQMHRCYFAWQDRRHERMHIETAETRQL